MFCVSSPIMWTDAATGRQGVQHEVIVAVQHVCSFHSGWHTVLHMESMRSQSCALGHARCAPANSAHRWCTASGSDGTQAPLQSTRWVSHLFRNSMSLMTGTATRGRSWPPASAWTAEAV
jgi:hypothetical protein